MLGAGYIQYYTYRKEISGLAGFKRFNLKYNGWYPHYFSVDLICDLEQIGWKTPAQLWFGLI